MVAGKRRFFFLAVLWSVVFIVLGGALNIALTNMKAAPARAEKPRPSTAVTTIEAHKRVYAERLVGYGRARPVTISEVAAGVSGDVVWTSPQLEPGNFVAVDTELVRIDKRDLVTAVQAARARLEQALLSVEQKEIAKSLLDQRKEIAAKELDISQQSYDRHSNLNANGTLSDYNFEVIRFEHERRRRSLLEIHQQKELADPDVKWAAAEVEFARAALLDAQTQLDRAVVLAPYTGFIDQRMVNLGSRVTAGTQLFRIIDTSQIEVPVALPSTHYGVVTPGTPAELKLVEDGPVVWQGNVTRVSPMIDDQDRTFFAYLVISSSPREPVVPAGAFVTAEVEGSRHEQVIVVPRTALIGDRVYVAQNLDAETGAAEIEGRIPVIHRLLSDVVLLESGVSPGERIVVSNVEKIAHGSRVVVMSD